jgi:hypothetical protein
MVRAIFAFVMALGLASVARAQSGGPADITQYETPSEARWAPFFGDLPKCDDTWVLDTILARFAETQSLYWGGVHAIGGWERMREIGFRSDGLSYIPRRYCVARALMVNPRTAKPDPTKTRTVVYSIDANAGIIGFVWGVEWCVVGLDPMRAYSPDCYVLRPILERWIGEYKAVGELYGLKARY